MKTSFSQLITGLIIIALGIGFLLDNLGVANFGSIIGTWWPMVIVLLGLIAFINNPRSFLFPLAAVTIGSLLQLRELDVLSFNIWSLIWPAILIFVGLNIIFDRLAGFGAKETKKDSSNYSVFLSGVEARKKSDHYEGGRLSAVLGGITLDLRHATLKDGAVLEVFTLMGGVELRVPENWRVHTSGMPILGGWEDKTAKPSDKKAPLLTIRGNCIMGGIEIKN